MLNVKAREAVDNVLTSFVWPNWESNQIY